MAIVQPVIPDIAPNQLYIPGSAELPLNGLGFSYDRFGDALYSWLYKAPIASLSVPLDRGDRDYFYLRVEFDTPLVTGFQIDHFLTYAITYDPWLSDALLIAEYPDSSEAQSAAIRKQAAERISQPWSDERFLDQLRRVVAEDPYELAAG